MSGVLGVQAIHETHQLCRPVGDVTQIADGRRQQIKPGRRLVLGVHLMKSATSRTGHAGHGTLPVCRGGPGKRGVIGIFLHQAAATAQEEQTLDQEEGEKEALESPIHGLMCLG